MAKLHFQLVTPERTLLSEEVDSLSCPTSMGQITILPHHASLVANLTSGELVAKTGSGEQYIHVSGGFIQVRPGNDVIALADAAQHHYEISEREVEEAVKRAQALLKEERLSEEEYAKVAASLETSLSKLHVVRKRAHARKTSITGEGVFRE